MREQSWLGLPCLPLSLNELEGLPAKKFELIAQQLGVTFERLREIVGKGLERKTAEQDARKKASDAETQLRKEYPFISATIRPLLKGMGATQARLDEAERLEIEAYRLLESGKRTEAREKFRETENIRMRDRLSQLCREFTLSQAFLKLRAEKRQVTRTSNIPDFRKVINSCISSVKNELDVYTYRKRPAMPEAYGPAQKFSVEHPLNYPRNPRPRRCNDELRHF